jgi:lipid kinase, YegS/Rv2252/BmrU family
MVKESVAHMKKKVLFIYNPNAGKELIKPKLAEIIDIIVKAGYEMVIYPTQSYQDAYRKITEYKDEYDLVICSGGDGTIDEVVTGMMNREERVPIGYIPTGTTNDFATSLYIPKNLLAAADTAVNGKKFPCDVGIFNEDIFVYIAAFGLFTDVSYQTKQEIKNVFGHLAYILEGSKRIFNIPSYEMKVTYDDVVIEEEFIFGMITNSRSVGGFRNMIGDRVVFDDGKFEVTLIKKPKNPIEMQEIIAALLLSNIDSKHMYAFQSSKISFESKESLAWTLDGEYGGEHDYVEIENRKQALEIMVPADKIKRIAKE